MLIASLPPSGVLDATTISETNDGETYHVMPGFRNACGRWGRLLKGLSERSRIAGDSLENNTENMRMWLTNPKSIKPATLMPNMGLTEEEVQIVIEYLNTL